MQTQTAPRKKGQCEGPFLKITEDGGGTKLWGYWQPDAAEFVMSTVSYFLTTVKDRTTNCTCADYYWHQQRADIGYRCKHMDKLDFELLPVMPLPFTIVEGGVDVTTAKEECYAV